MRLLLILTLFSLIEFTTVAQSLEWANKMGGPLDDSSTKIKIDDSKNVYVLGNYSGTVDFDPGSLTYNLTSNGTNDVFVCKFDSNGNFLWVIGFGGSNEDLGSGLEIDNVGNLYITGIFRNLVDFDPGVGVSHLNSQGQGDIFIAKFDQNGNFNWVKQIGSVNNEECAGITLDYSSNIYLTGYFIFTVDFDPNPGIYNLVSTGMSDIFICNLDSSGNLNWAKNMGGTGTDISNSICLDIDGNILTTGFYKSTSDFDPGIGFYNLNSAGAEDIFVSKLDSNGNFIWAVSMGGTGKEIAFDLKSDSSSNVYLTGLFYDTGDYDPGINTSYLTPGGPSDVFVVKLNSNGSFNWANQTTGNYDNSCSAITLGPNGNVWIAGFFGGTADFDPGPSNYSITSFGNWDIFVWELDSAGGFIMAKNYGGTQYDLGKSIVVDESDNYYLTGLFSGVANFNPPGLFTLSGNGNGDAFIAKYSNSVLNITPENNEANGIKIYPNPFTFEFKVECNNLFETFELTLYNSINKVVSKNNSKCGVLFNTGLNLPNGLYYLKITSSKSTYWYKLLKI